VDFDRLFDDGMYSPSRQKSDRAIGCNPEEEGQLRGLATKSRQRLPQRHGNFLEQIVSIAECVRVGGGKTRQSRPIGRQEPVEALFQNGPIQDLGCLSFDADYVSCRK
jgi:hypothetical protein